MGDTLIIFPATSFTPDIPNNEALSQIVSIGVEENKNYCFLESSSDVGIISTPLTVPHHYSGGDVNINIAGRFDSGGAGDPGDNFILNVHVEVYKSNAVGDFYDATDTHWFAMEQTVNMTIPATATDPIEGTVVFTSPEADNIDVGDLLTIFIVNSGNGDVPIEGLKIFCVELRDGST